MSKTATKSPAKRATPNKTAHKAPAKKAPAKKAPAKKAPARKSPVKKAPARKAPARKAPAKKAPAKKAPARKTQVKKAAAKPTTKQTVSTPRLPADVKLAVAAAQDKQALDLTVLDLRTASAFTDFFVVCTGANSRQVQAIADGIEAALKTVGERPALVEGYRRGEWILLDYFSFIVHVFLPSQRAFYALERLWGGAEPIEVSAD